MFAKRSLIFWLVLAGVLAASQVTAFVLAQQVSPAAWQVTTLVGWALVVLWTCWGLWAWRKPGVVPGIRVGATIILGSVAIALLTGVRLYIGPAAPGQPNVQLYLASWGLAAAGYHGTAIGLAGVWAMAAAFFLGLQLIRLVLSPGYPVFGVARTLIDEAIRMKIALVFIVMLVVIVPILPLIMDPAERLQYRLQSFLTYSLTLASILLSLMTVFLACGTISSEFSQRQIFLTMTKPLGRGQYLLGKWVGIVALNLLLITVTGGATFFFTKMLETAPARDATDRVAVEEQVLTARESVRPIPSASMNMPALFVDRFKQLYSEDPDSYGVAGLNLSKPEDLRRGLEDLTPPQRKSIETMLISKWHTIGPRSAQTFRFPGLSEAKKYGDTVQLRFKVNADKLPPDERIRLGMWVNNNPYPQTPDGRHVPLVTPAGTFQVIPIPLEALDKDGNLDIEIRNENLVDPEQTFPSSVSFPPGEGLEILYRTGGFEGNLVRSLGVMWLSLAFLAILGLASGTFLSFPVACLLSLMIYVCSAGKGFLLESLSYYTAWAPKDATLWEQIVWVFQAFFGMLFSGQVSSALKIPVRLLGAAFVAVIPSFSEFDAVPLLADGRDVSLLMLGETALWVGVVSSGVCGLVAWFIFRRRELARVIV